MPLPVCNNILVVRTDRIGDVVLTTPVLKALRQAYPAAKISMLVAPHALGLIQGNPYIDDILIDDRRKRNAGTLGFLRLARDIRRKNFDTAFIFHTKRRYNLACFLAGVPCRTGYKNNKFGFLLTKPLVDTRHFGTQHEVEYCLDVVRAFGVKEARPDILVAPQKDAEQWAAEWFAANGCVPGQIIAIHPGASDNTKRWPPGSFAKLINKLSSRYAAKIVLIGGKEIVPIADEIANIVPVLNLTGKTTVAQMVSVLRRSRLLISNDSGPMHIAAGVGIYVIGLFLRNQPGINHERWGPYGPKGYILVNKEGEEINLDKRGKKVESGKEDSIQPEGVVDLVETIFAQDTQSTFYW